MADRGQALSEAADFRLAHQKTNSSHLLHGLHARLHSRHYHLSDDSLSEAGDELPLDQPADTQVTLVDELVTRHLLCEAMERALKELPARYAQIIRMRHALSDDQPHALEAIAQKSNLSRERVRQIVRETLAHLPVSADIRQPWLPLSA